MTRPLDTTGELAFEDLGRGEPVLLIHGGIATTFVPLTRQPYLADRYRLVRYHRRGFAWSAPIAHPYLLAGQEHVAVQSIDAQTLLDHLGIDAAHVVGHSGGGVVGLQLALDRPGLVHSLILMEPATYSMKASWAQASGKRVAPVIELADEDPDGAAELLLTAVEGPEWRSLADTLGGADQWLSDTKRMLFEFKDMLDWSFAASDGSNISQPVLWMTGEKSPKHMESVRDLFADWVPQTEALVVPNAGHNMLTREPAFVAHAIADFVSRHPIS